MVAVDDRPARQLATFAVRSLTKSYAGVPVLRGVDLEVRPGEIHALLGANGAGKSTLIKCVAGVTAPDSGSIEILGTGYPSLTPSQSRAAGVAVIYQELSVTPTLSLADNVFLGSELRAGPFVRRRAQRSEAAHRLAELGVRHDVGTLLESVGTAEAQSVEIVKALRRDPKVLVLDEPTASLTEREAQQLAEKMRSLRAAGVPLLYVTHRLDEVFALADRVSILQAGRVVLSRPIAECTPTDLVAAIAGRDTVRGRPRPAPTRRAAPLLQARGLLSAGIGPIDLDLAPGEVLGVYGLVGSGRTELLEALFGAGPRVQGRIALRGRPLALRRPADAIAAGIALVPSDRNRRGIFGDLSAHQNAVLPLSRRLARVGLRRPGAERSAFTGLGRALQLRPMSPRLEARRFSGGNQQKLVVSRWLHPSLGCRVLLLDEPTQGVDVGARAELYQAVRNFVGEDGAAIVTSSEADELQQLAHRVLVLSRGRVAGVLPAEQVTEQRLLELAHRTEALGGTS